ncbi:MAG: hypothetical protein H7Y04_06075 [Verrucomicrobia bacterium]|nr:hypothetical protein [Cytophagales bacterium]
MQEALINQEETMGLTRNIENDLCFKQGKQEGIETGIEKGTELEKEAIANNLLDKGLSAERINDLQN